MLQHRGPDDCGVELVSQNDPVVVFGHRRLAIIDTSRAGHQPMQDPETGNWIIFNGEIYNFRELRRELESLGHPFATATDTEVLLKAYSQWGEECVDLLRGIFAFGIWDSGRGKVFLARDQLGVKPLYYHAKADTLVFGSEVRALLQSGIAERRLRPSGVRSYLAFGSVQDPQTLIVGIESLLPGHTLTFARSQATVRRYWKLPTRQRGAVRTEEAHSAVHAMLREATRVQMVSDVPLGAFLSGGIDSTAVVALMQEATETRVRTSSVVFDDADYDERKYSRIASERLGTRHTELLLSGDEVRITLPRALRAFDQPSMDGLNTYFVSKLTKNSGLTVALSGVGGDELFGGYEGYNRSRQAERWSKRLSAFPRMFRLPLAASVRRIARTERTRRIADLIGGSRAPYFLGRQAFGKHQIDQLLIPEMHSRATDDPDTFRRIEAEASSLDSINRASAFELQTYMLSTLLRDTDQMSMAHALEVRVPLLDHRLVELVFELPGALKVNATHPKPLLTQSLGKSIPAECVFRPKKGFELPFARWLHGSLREEMRGSFLSPGGAEMFRREALPTLWKNFEAGRVSWSRIWGIFVLRDWIERNQASL